MNAVAITATRLTSGTINNPAITTPRENTRPVKAMAYRPSRGLVEPSQRDHLEILAAKKISVQAEENKKIHSRRQHINRQSQQVENDGEDHQPQRRLCRLGNWRLPRGALSRIVERLDRASDPVKKKPHDECHHGRKQKPGHQQRHDCAQEVDEPIERAPAEAGVVVEDDGKGEPQPGKTRHCDGKAEPDDPAQRRLEQVAKGSEEGDEHAHKVVRAPPGPANGGARRRLSPGRLPLYSGAFAPGQVGTSG